MEGGGLRGFMDKVFVVSGCSLVMIGGGVRQWVAEVVCDFLVL